MSMSLDALRADYLASLQDAGRVFTPEDAARHLRAAAADMPRLAPAYTEGDLLLAPGVFRYDAPADLYAVSRCLWGADTMPGGGIAADYATPRPSIYVRRRGGQRDLMLWPTPSAELIGRWGAVCRYIYVPVEEIPATGEASVAPHLRELLLLRAQAEGAKELAMRGVAKPVTLRDGLSQGPRNATPAALFEQLMTACLHLAEQL